MVEKLDSALRNVSYLLLCTQVASGIHMLTEQEKKRLDDIVEKACVEASRDVIASATIHGTTVAVEMNGKTIEVQAKDLISPEGTVSKLFDVVGISDTYDK